MKIAIIDDEEVFQYKIYNITVAILPNSKITIFSNILDYQKSFMQSDVILLDIELPTINGLDFLAHYHLDNSYIV